MDRRVEEWSNLRRELVFSPEPRNRDYKEKGEEEEEGSGKEKRPEKESRGGGIQGKSGLIDRLLKRESRQNILSTDRYALLSDAPDPLRCRRNVLIFEEDDPESTRRAFQAANQPSSPSSHERHNSTSPNPSSKPVNQVSRSRKATYRVTCVSDLESALRVYRNKQHEFDLLVIGLRGPGFNTAKFLESIYPCKIPVLLTLEKDLVESLSSTDGQEVLPASTRVSLEQKSIAELLHVLEQHKKQHKLSAKTQGTNGTVGTLVAAIELCKKLGVTTVLEKPVDSNTLESHVSILMERFGVAAKEFKRMIDFANPDFAAEKAKLNVLQDIMAQESRRRKSIIVGPSSTFFTRQAQLTEKETIDSVSGVPTTRKSRFTMALKRNKAVQNAKMRVEQARMRRKMEQKFSSCTRTVSPKRKRSAVIATNGTRRGSSAKVKDTSKLTQQVETSCETITEGDHEGEEADDKQDTGKKDGKERPKTSPFQDKVRNKLLGENRPESSESGLLDRRVSDGHLALSVITSLAQKKTRSEGTLPLLKDYKGNLSFITLPWEEERQKQDMKEFGRATRIQTKDILQADFEEQVPTQQSATTSGQRFLQKGYELKMNGDLMGALRLYSRATMADQRYSAAYLCRGVVYFLLGDNSRALKDFTEALRLEPRSVKARFNRAILFSNDGQDSDALSELDEAITLEKSNPKLYSFRGFIHRRCGNFDKAREDYQRHGELLEELKARELEAARRKEQKKRSRILGEKDLEIDDMDAYNELFGTEEKEGPDFTTRKVWDTNYDGRIDLAEFTAATQPYDSIYSALFQQKSDLELSCAKQTKQRTREDLDRIERAMKEITLFRRIPERKLREIARQIKLVKALPGDYVIQQGAVANNFFAILEGSVNVTVSFSDFETEQVVNRMAQGDHFGESGLLKGIRRTANVVVPSDGQPAMLFLLSKELFLHAEMDAFLRQERSRFDQVLRNSMIFSDLNEGAFEEFTNIVRPVEFRHNTVLVRQGEKASKFCILVKGICKLIKFSDPVADLLKKKKRVEQELEQFEMSYSIHHKNVRTEKSITRAEKAFQRNELRRKELNKIVTKLAQLKQTSNAAYKEKKGKIQYTTTLYPGNFFGEEALLDPFYGKEPYSVVADTFVTLLVVHKDQLQTYKQSPEFLEKVRRRKNQVPSFD